jgi:hypothetical protein
MSESTVHHSETTPDRDGSYPLPTPSECLNGKPKRYSYWVLPIPLELWIALEPVAYPTSAPSPPSPASASALG